MTEPLDERLSDLGNARRFARLVGDEVRYVARWDQWLIWDGTHWRRDELGDVERLAQHVVESLHRDAAVEPNPERRKALARHALASDSARAIRGMLALAQSQRGLAIAPTDLDRDPWLLNVQNGTLELKTGRLRPHARDELISRLVPVAFDPDATCPIFETFLQRIFADRPSLVSFIQRAAGYALSGDTREQCFFLLHGKGSNGKSTLVGVLMDLFDSYAATVAAETLLARRGDLALIWNDLASLEGRRLVTAVEPDMGRRLAEAIVKQLTGGDRVKVKKLYNDVYEILPSFKVWLSTNHRPHIRGTDLAIWRRVRCIPFDVVIPDSEQDLGLRDKLEAERAGILAWAVRGCLAWQRDGLGPPDEVRVATAAYRAEQDVLGEFLAECCILEPGATEPLAALYKTYCDWAKDSGEPPLSKREFGQHLDERGCGPLRHGKLRTRLRQGVRLRRLADPDEPEADGRTQTDADSYNFSHVSPSRELLQKQRPRTQDASADPPSADPPPAWVTEDSP